MLRKNASIILHKKQTHNSVTAEIPPLIALLKAAISNLSLFCSKIFKFDMTNNFTCHAYEDIKLKEKRK